MPSRVRNGKKNLQHYLPRFQELSLFMAEGARSLFRDTLPAFAEQLFDRRAEIREASQAAAAALDSYLTFLRSELPRLPRGDWAIGKKAYDAMLKEQYLLPDDSDGLYDFAWKEFERTVSELEQVPPRSIPPRPGSSSRRRSSGITRSRAG
jgi:hypothetical protein